MSSDLGILLGVIFALGVLMLLVSALRPRQAGFQAGIIGLTFINPVVSAKDPFRKALFAAGALTDLGVVVILLIAVLHSSSPSLTEVVAADPAAVESDQLLGNGFAKLKWPREVIPSNSYSVSLSVSLTDTGTADEYQWKASPGGGEHLEGQPTDPSGIPEVEDILNNMPIWGRMSARLEAPGFLIFPSESVERVVGPTGTNWTWIVEAGGTTTGTRVGVITLSGPDDILVRTVGFEMTVRAGQATPSPVPSPTPPTPAPSPTEPPTPSPSPGPSATGITPTQPPGSSSPTPQALPSTGGRSTPDDPNRLPMPVWSLHVAVALLVLCASLKRFVT